MREAGALLWLVLLLASFWGLGNLCERLAVAARKTHAQAAVSAGNAGYTIVLGMALYTVIGGWCAAFSVMTFAVATGFVAVGLVSAVYHYRRALPVFRAACVSVNQVPGGRWVIVAVIAVTLGRFALALMRTRMNLIDDPMYQSFAHEILQRGASLQPFSVRRLQTYGGQLLFLGLNEVGVSKHFVAFFDQGLCGVGGVILLATLCWQRLATVAAKTSRGRLALAAVLLLAAAMEFPHQNGSSSELSGFIGFLALGISVHLALDDHLRLGRLIPIALCASYLIAVRTSFALPLTPLLVYPLIAAPDHKQRLTYALVMAPLLALGLGGWALDQMHCCQTPLFPLFAGTFSGPPGFFTGTAQAADKASAWLSRALLFGIPEAACACLLLMGRSRDAWSKVAASMGLCMVLGTAAMSFYMNISTYDIWRFDAAFTVASAWLLTLAVVEQSFKGEFPWRQPAGKILLTCVVCLSLRVVMMTGRNWREAFEQAAWTWQNTETYDSDAAIVQRHYGDAQDFSPPGGRLLSATSKPEYFDYLRNEVTLIDLPGMASPLQNGQHMPMTGADDFLRYLRSERFVSLIADQENLALGLYSRSAMVDTARAASGFEPLFAQEALKFLDVLGQLKKRCSMPFRSNLLYVLDLTKCSP